MNAGLDYALFGTSQSDQVLPGKDGWLFYKDGPNAAQPMANYQGLAELNDSADTLAEASAGLQILSDKLAENGCTLGAGSDAQQGPHLPRVHARRLPHCERGKPHRPAGCLSGRATRQCRWSGGMTCCAARRGRTPTGCCTTKRTPTGTPSARSSGWTAFLRRWTCRRARRTATPSRPTARPPVTWQMWRRSTPVCPPRRPT